MANSHGGSKCNSDTPNAHNAYEAKFQDMQKYIPFLEKMIQRLQRSKGGTRENQLAKMKSLYTILSDGKHRYGLTLESLEKCDSILRNLYQKVKGEDEDLMLQSLSPKNSDGKPVLPPTNATKAKENEPNPSWVLGSPQKPAPGFKKNFKKQKLAMVPGHAGLHQSTASHSKASATKTKDDQPNKHKVTKLCSKVCDLKAGKIKTNVKLGSKVSSSPEKEHLSSCNHSKSVVQPKKPIIDADQKKSIGNSARNSTIVSNEDKPVVSSPLSPHSSMNLDKKKETVCTAAVHHSVKNSKEVGNTAAVLHDSKKKEVNSSKLKQHSTSNMKENKNTIPSQIAPTSISNVSQAVPISGSSITQHSAPKCDLDKEKLITAKKSDKDERNAVSAPIRQPHNISSDKCLHKRNLPSGSDNRLHSSQPLSSQKRVESEGSTNVSDHKKSLFSSFAFKASETNTKPSSLKNTSDAIKKTSTLTSVSETNIKPSSSSEAIIKPSSTFLKVSETITKSTSTFTSASETIKKQSSTFVNTSETITKPSSVSEAITKPPSKYLKSSETIEKPSSTFVNSGETITKPPTTFENASEPIAKPPSTFVNASEPIAKPPSKFVKVILASPTKSNEPSMQNSTPTTLNESKFGTKDNMPNSPSTIPDQHTLKRPSPKDPRLARGLLTKSLLGERWKQPSNQLQECKVEHKQENVSCKTETRQQNATGKSEPSQSQSLRAKLAEQITTVHKVGTSVGGALRSLTKNLPSIEQNRIANLKPGTIIDLMDKELPKTNKKTKQDKVTTQISDQQTSKTNKSTISNLTQDELEKLVVKNIHNLPALPPDTKQILEMISTNMSQGSPTNHPASVCNRPVSDEAMSRLDPCEASTSNQLHNDSRGSLITPAMSEENSKRFDSSQKIGSGEFCRVEGKSSNLNSDQTSNQFDSTQTPRSPDELYDRGLTSASKSISDQATNRFDSFQYSRTNEFYNRAEESTRNPVISASSRFDQIHICRTNELYSRLGSPAATYSNWENPALDSVGMPSPFRIQSPIYTQTNLAQDTSCRNNVYHRYSGPSSPSYGVRSENDNLPLYGTNYMRDPRRRSVEQADCRSPESDDWQRVVIHEDRSQFTPDYSTNSDSVWSDDNSRFPSRYHQQNTAQNSSQYGRSHMTSRSNSTPSSRRFADHRLSPERTPERFSNSRSSLDYPEERRYSDSRLLSCEERRYSDSRQLSERRVSEARLKKYRDEPFPDSEHGRVRPTFRSSYDRSYNTSSADRYHSYSGRSGESQERTYSDSRSLSRNRDSDSYRSNRRESFTSPLDKLYSETRGPVTGRGYGVQNFRLPKSKPKESDLTSNRKSFDKNASQSEDASKSTELEVQAVANEIKKEDDSNEKFTSSNVSTLDESISKEVSHSKGESPLSEEEEKANEQITNKPLGFNMSDTDKILITASNFVEERKVVILLEKSDMESSKEKEISSSGELFDSKKSEVHESEVKSTPEIKEKQSVNENSDSISTTPQILVDALHEEPVVKCMSSENPSLTNKIDAASNVDSENHLQMSADLDNISMSSKNKSEIESNEKSEISREQTEIEDGNKKMDNDENDIAKPGSDDQKSKDKHPTVNSSGKDDINSDKSLQSTIQEKSNDDSIHVDLSDESEIPIEKESNDIQHCKIEEPIIKEENESSSSNVQSNEPTTDIDDEKSKLIHKIVEAFNKNKQQAGESKPDFAKIGKKINTEEKMRLLQQILELSDDENDTDEKNVPSEDIKPDISLDKSLQDEVYTVMTKDELSETSSIKSNDTSYNDDSNDLKLIETDEKSKQIECDTNRKKGTPPKRTIRGRSRRKTENTCNVETSHGVEISLNKSDDGKKKDKGNRKTKNELDRLHDGLREMFLKAEIEKTSGIRSCRLRNVNDSPETTNRKKVQKEKPNTMDNSEKYSEESEEIKDCSEHDNDKVKGNSQVELKDSSEDAGKDSEETSPKSSSCSNKEKIDVDSVSKVPEAITSTSDQKNQLPNNDNEHKSHIKSIMSSGSLRSTPIVLLQKSNVLMSIKPVPSKNSSTPNPVPESFETQSENIESDKVVQQTDPTVQPVQCKEVDDCHTSEETVQTNDKSAPKKPRKYLRKKHLPENLDKNKSVSVEKIERNPVILLEKRNLNESACQTNFETDVLPNENDSAPHTATAPDSDYNKNDTSMKISSSHTGTGKITSQRRPTFEYSELPNIFTDKSYHQKTTAHKPNCQLECKICHFFGKSIVKHYVTEHSDQDVLISRLEANDARDAIMKSNSEEISMKPSWFQCYMCSRLCTNLSSFYDHITSHTGEYRFRCQLCPFKVANRHAMKVHCTSTHSLDWRTSHRTAVVVDPIPDMKTVFGFICSDCYFVQLNKSTVEEHVKNHHSDASDVEIIRINMSSLEAQAANSSAGSNQRSNERQSIPSTGETHDDVSNDNSVQTVINVCAFSCTEPMNDLREKQSIMKEAFENIEETIFITERTVDEKISDKIGALSNYWQSLSGNDESLPQVDNDFQNETKTNIESDKVSETEVLENLVPVAEKEVEVMDFEVDQLDQVDETTILEEIRLVTSDSEDDTADNNRFGVCADDRINSLLDKFQKEHKNNEENGKRDGDDRDDFENDEVRDGDDLLNLISNVSGDSAGIKKVDIGPLTISRYNERVRFSCNIRSCQFRSDNPKYIVCHFGNHLTPSAKLHCNWCNEEFDCSMDAVGLMKGLVKHGLDHVLPSSQPPTPPQVAGKLGQPPGFLRVRRLSGDQLSIYSSEGESGSAGPSSAQQSTSSSSANDSLGHLRIESVFSAANCDAATLHELNSLHEPDTKFPNKPRNDAPTKPTFKFLVHFYKCMGTDCKFSTNNCLLYKEHLKSHTRRHRKRTITYSWFICSYCSREENCMSALVKHIHLYHSNSYYQCAHCTYRSASKSNVIFHQQMKHVDEQIKIYLCEKRPPSLQSLSSLKYSEIITAYQCLINDCMVRSFVWDAILKHIDLHHLAVLQCFMCKVVFTKENPLMLIQHFLLHGIGLYQCTYCRHGVNTTEEMRNHLCDKHPDQPPRVMMREVKTGATPLFLRGSDIDSNLRQLTGIILDDLEEPEGSVIDCTKFTDEPPKTQNVGPKMWVVDFENGKELLMDNSGTIFNVRPYQPRENVDMYARKDSEGFAGEWNAPSVLPSTPHEQSNTENQQTQEFAAPTVVESHQMLVKRPPPPVLSLLDLFKEQQKSTGVQQELRTATESHRLPVNRPEPSVIPPHNLQQSEATQPQQTVSNVAEEPTSSQVAAQKMRLEISGEAPRIINDVSIEISSDSEGRVEISSDSEANNDNVNVIQGGMCFVCHRIFDDLQQACLHLTTEHRITKTKTVPFFCNVNNMAVQVVRSEIVVCDTPTKSSIDLKTKFTMNEVELLPKKAILSTPIHCDHCGFSNVVVKNMKIHLQSHASGKQVSNSLLVNPVPCLEKNEKMFDKMINLAGSSHSQPAKTFELPPELPKFVPENVRYLCCVCNYRAINDQMLVQHITALHHDTSQYKCPHCIDCSVTIDKIVFHLRMHDVRLYRCSYCIFFHYQRHQVSKHLNEKHFEKKQFVQIVRDPDPVDDGFKSTEESGDEYNSMPKSYKVWQCAFCDIFKIKEIFIRDHCQRAHGIEDRFKCCFCAFISYCEDTVRAHFKDRHSGNTLQIAEAYNRVCIFAPKNPSLDLRLYFHQRRERNLRNNIRGITFDEPSSSRRTMDHGIQAWTSFKCPECGLITKNKEELIKHLWTEYTIIQIELPPEKKKEIKQWIDMVIQYQEAKISEQPKINETGGSEPKRRNSSGEDSTSSRSKKQHSRKRALPRGDVITLSDSGDSDNSGDSKKQKKTRIEDSLYICGYCNYKDFLVGSQKHQEERHPNRPWKVQMISPDHQSNQNLAKPKTTVYECQICGKVDLRTALLEHFRLTHPSSHVKMSVLNCELFKCNHCGHVDDSLDRLSAHSSGAHPKMPFDVHAVTKQESSSDEVILIQDHSTSTDTDNMQYACSSCNAIFNAQHACILHIKKEHGSNASIKIVSKFGSDSSNSGSSPIPPRVAAPSTSGIHRRADLVKKPARKSPIAKKSTSKVRRVENNPDKDEDDVDKVYFSKVVLKDLRNVPQQ